MVTELTKHFANYENSKIMQQLGFENTTFEFDWYLNPINGKPEFKNWWESFKHNYRYDAFVTAPLWQQVVEWLDSKFGIAFVINFDSDMDAVLHDILEQLLIKKNGKLK